MDILAAILMLSASGQAERRFESDDSIAGIVAQCVWGVKDVIGSQSFGCVPWFDGPATGVRKSEIKEACSRLQTVARTAKLRIDNEPRTGLRSWGEAALRVAGYIADVRSTGSVGYQYRLRVRGYDIRRETRISDGHVLLTTDAWWTERVHVIGRIYRNVPCHVRIAITADERDGKTLLVVRASGTADTSEFRCGIVRSIAERQASEQFAAGLPEALRRIEAGGKRFYANGGDIADALDAVRLGIKIGNVFRRR